MKMLAPLSERAELALLPEEAPLAMPRQPLNRRRVRRRSALVPGTARRRAVVVMLTVAAVALLGWLMANGLGRDGFGAADAAILSLYLPNITWIAFAAATALCGVVWHGRSRRPGDPGADWLPRGRTAVLIPARNEDIRALRGRIMTLRADLGRRALRSRIDIFVLSDSDDPDVVMAERDMVRRLVSIFPGWPPVYYRNRTRNTGRKPGNVSEWVRRWGGAYAYMLVLDADSRMTARRVAGMIHKMETRPDIGLLQAGVRLAGAESRFGRLQQMATRLYGPAFSAGIAGWSGNEGNYWGHNALIRVQAFAAVAGLPRLSGRPPFGGDILSHDFVEAAWLRRAGWSVVLDPDVSGSAEGGPETMEEFHKRDRRWCQGNLQHLRIVGARGLHPVSRLHLVSGIGSYLAAPLWLAMVFAATLAGGTGQLFLPLIGALVLILAQKLAGVAIWAKRRPQSTGRFLRMALGELAVSFVAAPIIMVRQTLAVASVFAGQDCGWKPAAGAKKTSDAMPWLEPAVAVALVLAALPGAGSAGQLALIMPLVLPLLAAPAIVRWLDLPAWDTGTRWNEPMPVVVAIPVRGRARPEPSLQEQRAA